MILIDNQNVLQKKDPNLLNQLIKVEKEMSTGLVVIEEAKTGALTLKMTVGDKTQYLHSKYDPEKEAKQLIGKVSMETRHVLFIGVGMGYHIKAYMTANPNAKFSIYEPNEEVLLAYLTHVNVNELPLRNLVKIFTGLDEEVMTIELEKILQSANAVLQAITLPFYEKNYEEQVAFINRSLVKVLNKKRMNLATIVLHQKRWTINSIKNFPKLLETPNILHDVNRDFFRNKPAIIVAAGPSLNEEYEYLRYIKDHGLAYIFSVGSAINSLIEQGIYPDATCSFDPQAHNHKVIQKVNDYNIKTIPLVFGSTIGFESLENYPGEMLHMITGPDTVSPKLLDTTQSIDIVWDAPTVAAVTFQLLGQLECNPIILVGQNLAYQDHKRYADGIQHDFISSEVKDGEIENAETIKDVYGNDIQTNIAFNSMRNQLELYIQMNKNIEVINTTKGGAEISGSTFIELKELVENRLKSKVVVEGWTDTSNSYDTNYIQKQLTKVISAEKKCGNILTQALNQLEVIAKAIINGHSKGMEKKFASFDKDFNKLKSNVYYQGFIEPMLKVQNEQLSEESQFIRYESDALKKAAIVVQSFEKFIHEVDEHIVFVKPYFDELQEKIEMLVDENSEV